MDIYERLKEDHGRQKGLAGGIAETSGDSTERKRLFEEFKKEVETHAAVEEQTFYAGLISHEKDQEQARHSVTEYEEASALVKELV